MRLVELEATFLQIKEPGRLYQEVNNITDAHGIQFLCPVCFVKNGGSVGTHSVICWDPRGVSPDETPGPGRWEMVGTCLDDLTLRAGSSSIKLNTGPDGCEAHFYVENGAIRSA